MDVGKYKVNVTFDFNTEVDSNEQFEYLPDPVIKATEPTELRSISRYFVHILIMPLLYNLQSGQPLNGKQNS